MRRIAILFAAAIVWCAPVVAQQPTIAAAPGWVKVADVPAIPAATDAGAVQVLLVDTQMNFSDAGDETYTRSVFRILTSQGLATAGTIALNWNPETENLTIHNVKVLRDGQAIDVLAKQDLLVLRRETNLQYAMLDGVLTATMQPEGLKVGDTIDLAATVTRKDPIMGGRSENRAYAFTASPTPRWRMRATWPAGKEMTWRVTEDIGKPVITKAGGTTELLLDLRDLETSRFPAGAPLRFMLRRGLELSDFKTWADVSSLFAPLYDKASTLAADSELRAEIDRIKAASSDPKVRATMALALVQEQVRYVFLGMELGALKPADADRTWSRRFGDCKGKTALLLALLRELGVTAEPALVSTRMGDGLNERLPQVSGFDHIIVRAVIGGKVYWLDGTRTGDTSLDLLTPPDFHWALPVRRNGGALEKLELAPLTTPELEVLLTLDATGGIDKQAPVIGEMVLRGDSAKMFDANRESQSATDMERSLKSYWQAIYPWIEPQKVSQSAIQDKGEVRLVVEGLADMDWQTGWNRPAYEIEGASMGGALDYSREDGPDKDAPFMVAYPMFNLTRTMIKLPDRGRGFVVRGENIDEAAGGIAYKRTTKIADGVATMEATSRSLVREISAADGAKVEKAMLELSKKRVFVLAPGEGGEVTAQTVAQLIAGGDSDLALDIIGEAINQDPKRADYHMLRAQALVASDDDDGAIASMDKAIELEPSADNYAMRSMLRKSEDIAGRRSDAAAALKLEPTAIRMLSLAAQVEVDAKAYDDALALMDKALAIRPSDPHLLIDKAEVFARKGETAKAITIFDQARAGSSGDWMMLNSLCWAKGTNAVGLESALEDCNASLAARPRNAATLDSRALIHFRLGDFDKAIADYDAALAIAPGQVGSRYVRGIAKLRKGMTQEGQADIAEATKDSDDVAKRYEGYGVRP